MDFFTKSVPPDKAAIAGIVADASGRPVAWATVLITGSSPRHQDIAATTNGHGQYRFDGLAPGNYTLLVNASGYNQCEGQTTARKGMLAHLDFTVK